MVKVICKQCGKMFEAKIASVNRGWGIYCSIKCQHESMKIGKIVKCHNCKKQVYKSAKSIRRSQSKLYFCNHSCQVKWHNQCNSNENHHNWKNGRGSYRIRLQRAIDKPKCHGCGTADARILSAHHKDKNRENNSLDNLEWLCHNCHHLVHKHNEKI